MLFPGADMPPTLCKGWVGTKGVSQARIFSLWKHIAARCNCRCAGGWSGSVLRNKYLVLLYCAT